MEKSTGILVYRIVDGELHVLLGKCGGPKWTKRSVGAWNIPKGHLNDGETDLSCAVREFNEETSLNIKMPTSCDEIIDLGESVTGSGKVVKIFALEYNFAVGEYRVNIKSNMVKTEWPPRSSILIDVPEMSEAYYFKINVAKKMIFPYQKCFLDRLEQYINESDEF